MATDNNTEDWTQKEKIAFGRLLSEVYKIRNLVQPESQIPTHHIYALRKGIESAIDEEIETSFFVPDSFEENLSDALEEFSRDEDSLAQFEGYYSIEDKLNWRHGERPRPAILLRYWKAKGIFADLIEKMDSQGSPTECRNFELREHHLD